MNRHLNWMQSFISLWHSRRRMWYGYILCKVFLVLSTSETLAYLNSIQWQEMENFVIIAVFVFTGMLFRRLEAFPPETVRVLNMFALYVSLPAVILLKVPQISFGGNIAVPIIIINGTVIKYTIIRVDIIKKLLAVVDPPRMGGQIIEQPEFGCHQLQVMSVQRGAVT